MGRYKKIKKNIFIRISLIKNIGLGHLLRNLRIIEHLHTNYKINFVVDKFDQELNKNSNINKYNFISLYKNNQRFKSEKSDSYKFCKILNKSNKSIVIVDDYRLSSKWHKNVIKNTTKLVVIDDLMNKKFFSDIYINYSTNNNLLDMAKRLNKKKTKLLLGTKFCVLGKNLKKIKRDKRSIMINFGNSFDFNNLKKFIKNLVKEKFKLYICIGIYAKNYNYLLELEKKHKNLKIIYKRLFIEEALNKVGLFIGSMGNAIYEMSYIGTPSIFFTTAKNQTNEIKNMEKLGHFFSLKKKDIYSSKLIQLIRLLNKNYDEILNLNKNKILNVDKKGSIRIANEIIK